VSNCNEATSTRADIVEISLVCRRLEFALFDQVIHFRWENKAASIISPVEVGDNMRSLGRLVFLDEMAGLWKDL